MITHCVDIRLITIELINESETIEEVIIDFMIMDNREVENLPLLF